MFSWVAIDRFAEKERTKDATFRKQSADKVLRSDAQSLTDDDLLTLGDALPPADHAALLRFLLSSTK